MVKHTKGWESGNFLTVKSMQNSEGKEARDWLGAQGHHAEVAIRYKDCGIRDVCGIRRLRTELGSMVLKFISVTLIEKAPERKNYS